tara:strand:- start:1429 stop:1707 length:279 start_codon:yes stop_codon:yes gene_type:complete
MIDKFDIVHSLYNAATVGYDNVNNKWTAEDKDGNSIDVVSTAVDAEFAKQEYKNKRASEYPSVVDQLDLIYHSGIDAWKAKIKETKDKYPKS